MDLEPGSGGFGRLAKADIMVDLSISQMGRPIFSWGMKIF
jgi:hypothetical protein